MGFGISPKPVLAGKLVPPRKVFWRRVKVEVGWLNNLPAVRDVLTRDFGGRPVNHQNLSAWRAGGYREWNFRREIIMNAIELQSQSAEAGFSRKSDCRKVMQGLKEVSGLHMNA